MYWTSYSNGPRCPSACLSHANISETKPNRHTGKLEQETGLPDSESAVRFAIGSTVQPFWVFTGWHFVHSDRNGPVGLVNVVNGSVGTVISRHHTGHRGGPAIVTSHSLTDDTLFF